MGLRRGLDGLRLLLEAREGLDRQEEGTRQGQEHEVEELDGIAEHRKLEHARDKAYDAFFQCPVTGRAGDASEAAEDFEFGAILPGRWCVLWNGQVEQNEQPNGRW
jgi:hypothetical protein